MIGDEAVLAVIGALETLKVPYMLVGSLASNFYGVPRATEDADFVIELGGTTLAAVADALGPEFRVDRQVSFETITMTTRHLVELPSCAFTVELFRLSDDAHDQERFRRRRAVTLLGRQIFVLSAEDVVITKLRWAMAGNRAKDRDDACNVIAVQCDRLDWVYISQWSDRHGTRALLDELRGGLPPSAGPELSPM